MVERMAVIKELDFSPLVNKILAESLIDVLSRKT